MKCTHVCAAQKAYYLFTKLLIKPDFPSLADEIAEPRPGMNIKVAAFTVSKKSSNTKIEWAGFYVLKNPSTSPQVHKLPFK